MISISLPGESAVSPTDPGKQAAARSLALTPQVVQSQGGGAPGEGQEGPSTRPQGLAHLRGPIKPLWGPTPAPRPTPPMPSSSGCPEPAYAAALLSWHFIFKRVQSPCPYASRTRVLLFSSRTQTPGSHCPQLGPSPPPAGCLAEEGGSQSGWPGQGPRTSPRPSLGSRDGCPQGRGPQGQAFCCPAPTSGLGLRPLHGSSVTAWPQERRGLGSAAPAAHPLVSQMEDRPLGCPGTLIRKKVLPPASHEGSEPQPDGKSPS